MGRIERALLEALDREDKTRCTFELASIAFGGTKELSAAQLASTHRALESLRRRGKAGSLGRRYHDMRSRWASAKHFEQHESLERQAFPRHRPQGHRPPVTSNTESPLPPGP